MTIESCALLRKLGCGRAPPDAEEIGRGSVDDPTIPVGEVSMRAGPDSDELECDSDTEAEDCTCTCSCSGTCSYSCSCLISTDKGNLVVDFVESTLVLTPLRMG